MSTEFDDDSTSSGNHKFFKFDIIDNQVVAVYEYNNGELEQKSIDGNESYAINGNKIVRTEVNATVTEITYYSDNNGDGFYNRISEQWEFPTDAPGVLPGLPDTLSYLPTDNDDRIAVREGELSQGGLGADDFVIREAAHLRIDDFNSGDNDRLVFDTGLGIYSREQLELYITGYEYNGHNFTAHFGSSASITLVGVTPENISWDFVSVVS